MTEDERKGKRIVTVLAIAILIPPVLMASLALLLGVPEAILDGAIRWAILAVMAWLMYRGYAWAMAYIAFILFIHGLATAVMVPLRYGIWAAILSVPLASVYIGASWILWRSPSVDAYCERMAKRRDPILSLTGSDGV